jgi:hypothetical protein
MSVVDDARHDTASLHRFVSSIYKNCDPREGGKSYLPSSDEFFKYIRALGNRTLEFLETFSASITASPSYNFHRQKLWTLRTSWFELHQYIKPAADAHTLSLPGPLIEGLLARFHELADFADTSFAVFHIDELNYLQVIASGIRGIAADMAAIIPNAPTFPEKLGLIGIPYSQSSSVFLNCLIPHEMGHFAYGEKSIAAALATGISASLNKAFAGISLDVQTRKWLTDVLQSWSEEIFCDLFAIWLIGPCYSYAFVEIVDLPNILTPTAGLNVSGAGSSLAFSPMHPGFLFRVKQHVELLKKLGWWSEIDVSKSHYYKVLELSETLPDSSFTFPRGATFAAPALRAFFEVTPLVDQQVRAIMTGIDTGLTEYRKFRPVVQEYFRNGVVPSTILNPGDSTTAFPSPVTVLNSAYTLYLESLDWLISGIQGQDCKLIEHRQKWTEKLEMWTMKAIEDHKLLVGQKE